MAKIVEVTNPVTGQPAQVDQLDHTAQQIDDAIARALPGGYYDKWVSQLVNPNLLDNWYFANPVNQRGQTRYSEDWAYTIDRWQVSQNTTLTVNNGSVSSTGGYWYEPLEEIVDALRGRTVTISLLFASGELEFATGVVPTTWGSWDNIALSGHVGLQGIGEDSKRLWFMVNGNAENILAAKLELGSQQTLVHQDENGVWVLNEIPDYGEQLARCQRYCIEIVPAVSDDYGNIGPGSAVFTDRVYVCVPLPVTMRAKPTVSYTGNWKLVSGVAAADGFDVNWLAVDKISNNSVTLNVTTANQVLTVGKTYHLWRTPASKNSMLFSADL